MAVDLDDVVPTIYSAALLDELSADPDRPLNAARYYEEPLTDGLVVAYSEDLGTSVRILAEDEVAGLRVGADTLRARAVENLRRRLQAIEQHGGPEVLMVSADGTYEASLLLVDDFWDTERLPVDGDFVVAVPSHDVLMVTGSSCSLGIARLRQLAQENFEKGSYPLTTELLVRRDGQWSVLPSRNRSQPPPQKPAGLRGLLRGLLPKKPPDEG